MLSFVLIFCLAGCGVKYPDLPESAIAFTAGSFTDEADDNAGYFTIEYNGRTYMPYGTIKGVMKSTDIDKCIGYIVQDENTASVVDPNDKDTRIYTLTADKENNFLMEYYIGTTLMNQPSFYRAVDTRGKVIFVPEFIDSLEYNYWA